MAASVIGEGVRNDWQVEEIYIVGFCSFPAQSSVFIARLLDHGHPNADILDDQMQNNYNQLALVQY